jgi:hypothetical protein
VRRGRRRGKPEREKSRRAASPTVASKTPRRDEKSRRGAIKASRGKAGTD